MFKKVVALIASAVLAAGVFTGCAPKLDDVDFQNFTAPAEGEEIAVITFKDFGQVKIKFFPELAEKGVENFVSLAKDKYYDELIMHRIIEDFMVQGGDPKGNGTGGSSFWGEDFEIEATDKLYNFTGAVCYAHAQGGGNGSQFYIVNSAASNITDDTFKQLSAQGLEFPANVKAKYKEVGGAPHLDGNYTVFGQVFEGMDVIQKISEVEVDGSDKPIDQVIIEKVEIVKYNG